MSRGKRGKGTVGKLKAEDRGLWGEQRKRAKEERING
jgi:hypothetical protein